MHTMILCLGNKRLPGDGIAAQVGRILTILPLPLSVSVRVVNTLDWECVDAIVECDQLIIVDAMTSGNEPGRCFIEQVSPEFSPTFRLYCRHRQVVKDIVDLTLLLAQEGSAKRLVFIGVEIGGTREDAMDDRSSVAWLVPLVLDSVRPSLGAEVAVQPLMAIAHPQAEAEARVGDGYDRQIWGVA